MKNPNKILWVSIISLMLHTFVLAYAINYTNNLSAKSKFVDQKHQQAILENQQDIKFIRMSIGYYE